MLDYLFICFNHRLKDPRLYYRQVRILNERHPDIKIGFAKDGRIYYQDEVDLMSSEDNNVVSSRSNIFLFRLIRHLNNKIIRFLQAVKLFIRIGFERPQVIQASDARELFFVWICKIVYQIPFIYDSHEDYPRQILDYSKNSFTSRLRAKNLDKQEKVFSRYADEIFCTDDHLLEKYRDNFNLGKKVHILRNFPVQCDKFVKDTFETVGSLKLVYIGGVNEYRGIREVAEFCSKFNSKFRSEGFSISFDIYAPENKITEELLSKDLLTYHNWINFSELQDRLVDYDVGVCLWQDIPKFRLNLPLKNFDYMSVGLPIITSNFGNLKEYAEDSGAALCISPDSYEEFEKAIFGLFDGSVRRLLSENGRKYVRNQASFEVESEFYSDYIGKKVNAKTTGAS